ncbi:alpha-amylase [Paenalkalicoccus suaedae]|uniref:Alpha-amylase n=2 Tax=Paenalkalicoccus suaedae TaxID=2592382 RepID=A0A859FKC0_9BACI|nr:alpha-amylase [Paenalkalicoccus suaedae]
MDTPLLNSYPETVYYEVFVRAFADSNGDGIGDLKGLTENLDYIKELGAEGIWLMPINPSPSYHGYDVTDYYGINEEYGTLDDFKELLRTAEEMDLKIIMDYVVNHSSYDHPWFMDAISNEDSDYRDWYIWADEETNLSERGEWGQSYWHGTAPNQYMSVFWDRMPDLNLDNEEVRQELIDIGDYWLSMGVDGFRLDAAKHIFPSENEKSVAWWQEFRAEMEQRHEDVFLLGEVWDVPAVVGPYLDDALHATFNFNLAEELLSAARSERGSRLVSSHLAVLERYEEYSDTYIDATFLTNHDIDRVMSQLQGNEDRAKMAASLLLTLPGAPFVYYGEELGMEGRKPDEHIREPFIWGEGEKETDWIAARHPLEEDKSVASQMEEEGSMWRHYQTWMHLRRQQEALLTGDLEEAPTENENVISFKRESEDQSLYVYHNMSSEEVEVADVSGTHFLFADSDEARMDANTLILPPYSSAIIEE